MKCKRHDFRGLILTFYNSALCFELHSTASKEVIVKTRNLILLGSAFFLSVGTAWAGGKIMKARADIVDAKGKKIGTATLVEKKKGVSITLKVSGLSPGKHGFHLHENGVCEPPDFKSAGAHFNPLDKKHGVYNPAGKHAGDLPNLVVKEDGTAKITAIAEGATLGDGPVSLFQEGGASIVIHADPDDEMTDPAGNAGARIACGVVVAK